MLHLKNFSRYSPDTNEEKKIELEFQAIFYQSENGDDWYKSIPKFNEDTYKIKYDKNNVVCAINKQASTICPEDGSIVEMTSLPNGVDVLGGWQYINGVIITRKYTKDELITQAEKRKQKLLTKANAIISPLQDAVDLEIATKSEILSLNEWKKYRIILNRIDCTKAPNIDWLKAPE
ncbi:tail fiber assembly protein [Xenorhabdus ishibashii]|uniref:Tail fiber assembly protein n=1 Tax=Xenorhabdus ishibashii TaxID=1034471 RepID=A0A2D0KDM5_9GAMM|nr:tail fiber assembly protein [Xenorhabdus ishibashii]PHM61510.1 tail fiber assembly protein [Xenorhabdus ishibashii]